MPKAPPLTIAETIVLTGVRLKTIANRFVFAPIGLTGSKFRILRMLDRKQKMQPGEIIKFAGGTKSNVSQRLNSLEKQGYAERFQPPRETDRRKVYVRLTPKGKAILGKVYGHFQRSTDSLKSHFSEKELAAHVAFFRKLNGLLDERKEEIPELFKLEK